MVRPTENQFLGNSSCICKFFTSLGCCTTVQQFFNLFDASGNQTFADRNVDKLEGVNHNPSVAMALDGTFVVAWDNTQNDNSQVFAKGFKADGTDRYDKLTVNSVNNGTQRNPSVGMNERSGFFYVTYEDDADQNKAYRIKAAGYNAEGKRQVADIFISDQGEDAVEPAMCIDQSDSAVFAWTARKLNNGDIRFRVLNNNLLAGTTRTAHRAVSNSNNHDAGVQDQPALGCTDNGKFVILWHDNEDHGTKGKDDDTNGFEILGHGYNEM